MVTAKFLKTIKYAAIAVALLMLTGIAAVMFLARNTNEDITGVVSPALLITLLSVAAAVGATVLQRKAHH